MESNITNVHRSHDWNMLYFEVPAWATTNAIHVVDLNTFEEKLFTDGTFIQNVVEYSYTFSVIVKELY